MKISFNIEVEDIVAFNEYYYYTNPKIRKQRWRTRLMLPLLFIIIGLIVFFHNGMQWGILLVFGLMGFFYFFFWPDNDESQLRKKIYKEIDKPENAIWFGNREMTFDHEKVRIVFDKGEETTLWSAFVKTDETEDHFFLFQTPRQALVIPKQQITPAEVEELRSLFSRYIAVNISETKNNK